MQVSIISSNVGIKWAGKMLKHKGVQVNQNKITQKTKIIVTDVQQNKKISNKNIFRIILIQQTINNAHSLALSGVLSTFGQKQQIFIPRYMTQMVIANSLTIMVLQLVYQIMTKKNIQPFDKKIRTIQLLKYFGTFNVFAKNSGLISEERGKNLLEGGAPFYGVYKCKQGFLAVGNLQSKFYQQMIQGLPFKNTQQKQFCQNNQLNKDQWPKLKQIFTQIFLTKSAKQWHSIFQKFDTCITEIVKPFKSEIIQPKIAELNPKL